MSETRLPARSVLFLQAKPGMRDALVDVFRRIDVPGNALRQEGCLSVEVQVPPDEEAPVLVTALWTHREAYDGWLDNPWREYSGSELAPFLDGESHGVVYDVVLAGGDISAVAAGAHGATPAAVENLGEKP
jgi:quinol monooxygenase YgiN